MITVERLLASLTWLVEDCQFRSRSNDTNLNVEEGSQGGYSRELTEATALLEELQNWGPSALLSQSTIQGLSALTRLLSVQLSLVETSAIVRKILKEDGIDLLP